MEEQIFFHIWDGHFKFWGLSSHIDHEDKHRVAVFWGSLHHPKTMRQQSKVFHTSWGYNQFIKRKVHEKCEKGYIEMPFSIWRQYCEGVMCITEMLYRIDQERETQYGNQRISA